MHRLSSRFFSDQLLNATPFVMINGVKTIIDDYTSALTPPSAELRRIFSEGTDDKEEEEESGRNTRPRKRVRTE